MNAENKLPAVLPGSTIGIFGSGQLGKMMTTAAKQLGYRVHVFSPGADTPAGQVADREFQADYEDLEAVEQFAKSVDVITLEFENIPVAALAAAGKHVRVYPGDQALAIPQIDRWKRISYAITVFRPVSFGSFERWMS